jgi:hypothetical protein
MNRTIGAELGRAELSSLLVACRTLKKEDCDHLCELMTLLKVKASALLDCEKTAVALKDFLWLM